MFLLSDFADKKQKVNVKSYQRLRNGRLQNVQSFDSTRRKKDEQQESNIGRNLLAGAAVVGTVGLGAVLLKGKVVEQAKTSITTNYNQNLAKSTQKQFSPKVRPLEYKDADILFAVNGANGMPQELDQYNDVARGLQDINKGNKKINVIPFTVQHNFGSSKNPIQIMDSLYASEKATDKVAELAATVAAYKEKYPNKKITMFGWSMGGSIVTNAADLMQDSKVQTIALSAPNIRGVQPPNYTAVRLKNDGLLPDEVFTGKEIVIDDVQGHNNGLRSKKGFDMLYKKLFGG